MMEINRTETPTKELIIYDILELIEENGDFWRFTSDTTPPGNNKIPTEFEGRFSTHLVKNGLRKMNCSELEALTRFIEKIIK